jgi:hypothetical protein
VSDDVVLDVPRDGTEEKGDRSQCEVAFHGAATRLGRRRTRRDTVRLPVRAPRVRRRAQAAGTGYFRAHGPRTAVS